MNRSVGTCFSALAVLSMVIPVSAFESNAVSAATPAVTDVALTPDGQLVGTIVGKDGMPLANRKVQVLHNQAVVAEVQTDRNGRYEVEGLRSGFHVVRSPNTELACRFWAANVAPPSAKNGLVYAEDAVVIRGQGCGEDCTGDGCGEGCNGRGSRGRARGLFGGFGAAGVPIVGIGAFVAAGVAVGAAAADGKQAAVQPASP